jgi:putative tricarboxylic transport membrane protein
MLYHDHPAAAAGLPQQQECLVNVRLSRGIARAAAATALLCAPLAAPAQGWEPRRNVEIVVGADPGGALDFTARLLHSIWRERKLLEGVVVNKPGAGNSIAWTYLNQRPGDANYVAIASPNLFTNPLLGVNPLSHRDVTPLAVMLTEYIVVIVRPDSPLKSIRDAVGPLRKDAGALAIGMSPGIGSPAYTAAGIAMKEAGVDAKNMRLIIYKAAGAVITALLGGDIDMAFVAAPNVPPMLAANRVRAIAISAPGRAGGELAAVPTFREQGINATYENWRGLIGPRDLKPEQIAFWENAILQATRSPEWHKALEKNSWGDRYMNNAQSRKFFEEQFALYQSIYTALGAVKP